jgi:alpha-beta hydrolase superfamily lysophospholipase
LVVEDGYHELHNETEQYRQIFIKFLEQAFAKE